MATQMINVKDMNYAGFKKDSARALWFGALRNFNGKTPEEFVEAATKAPPVLKKDGKAEHPAGWLRYFMKEGVVQLVKTEAPESKLVTEQDNMPTAADEGKLRDEQAAKAPAKKAKSKKK